MSEYFFKLINRTFMGIFITVYVTGCAGYSDIDLDSDAHLTQIQNDKKLIYGNAPDSNFTTLTLDDAVNQAIKNNLDFRVAAIETLISQDNVSLAQLQALPNITASGTYTRRNNLAASSSQSILTGTQSLEPSTSSEQNRRLTDIEAQWNIIDVVVAYLDGQSAKDRDVIAQERLKKVRQNIEVDTINAYWRAYAGQQGQMILKNIVNDGDDLVKKIEKSYDEKLISLTEANDRQGTLRDSQKALRTLNEDTQLAQIELKSLMTLPISKNIILTTRPADISNRFKTKNKSIEYLIQTALQNRPELREVYMDGNISVKNTEREILSSFPGLNLIYGGNYDSNDFLNKSTWSNFSAVLSQSLTDFITLPTRYRASKNNEALTEERRKALTAAIIAQVYISDLRVDMAEKNYNLVKHQAKNAVRQSYAETTKGNLGVTSKYGEFIANANAAQSTIDKHIAFAELQRAYGDMYRTLGLSVSEWEGRI